MFIPIDLNFIADKLLLTNQLSNLTDYEKAILILLTNILFFISFKFFYSIFKDVIRSIFRTIKGILK